MLPQPAYPARLAPPSFRRPILRSWRLDLGPVDCRGPYPRPREDRWGGDVVPSRTGRLVPPRLSATGRMVPTLANDAGCPSNQSDEMSHYGTTLSGRGLPWE